VVQMHHTILHNNSGGFFSSISISPLKSVQDVNTSLSSS
jgi:hypothetical protein